MRSWRTRLRRRRLRTWTRLPSWRSVSGLVNVLMKNRWTNVEVLIPPPCSCIYVWTRFSACCGWTEAPGGRLTKADEGAMRWLQGAAEWEDGQRHGNHCLQVSTASCDVSDNIGFILLVWSSPDDWVGSQIWPLQKQKHILIELNLSGPYYLK